MEKLLNNYPNIYIFLFLLLFTIFLFFSFVLRSFKNFIGIFTGHRNMGLVPSIVSFLVSLVSVGGILLFLLCFYFTRSYHPLPQHDVVALIECKTFQQGATTFELAFTSVLNRKENDTRVFRIAGDQWLLEGKILKWSRWLNLLGVPTMYKLTQIRGRYLNIKDELSKGSSVHILAQDPDSIADLLAKIARNFHIANYVHKQTEYISPVPDRIFKIYLTITGFEIKNLASSH